MYILFRCLYDYTSYIWLNLGLHPKINIQISTEDYIFSKMYNVPTDLIKIIVQFIPPENYITFTKNEKLLQTMLDNPDKSWNYGNLPVGSNITLQTILDNSNTPWIFG